MNKRRRGKVVGEMCVDWEEKEGRDCLKVENSMFVPFGCRLHKWHIRSCSFSLHVASLAVEELREKLGLGKRNITSY